MYGCSLTLFLGRFAEIDVTIDGADEVDPQLNAIKVKNDMDYSYFICQTDTCFAI